MTPRRDYSFEALAEVTGTNFSAGRGELNAALKSIREQADIPDDYLLADEIHERAKMYRRAMPDVMLTPTALAKHWQRVFEEANRKPAQASNRSTPVNACSTCSGDRFVVAGIRPPEIEELAVCPDCNAGTDTSFWRFDGSFVRSLDPAKVRELMQR